MSKEMTINDYLVSIQKQLKAPKGQRNTFGKYNYRSNEDILEAVKPIATALGCSVIQQDELVELCGSVYVKATTTLISESGQLSASAYAKEALSQAGMSAAMLTGSSSSYARKYSANGLFAIDDSDSEVDAQDAKKVRPVLNSKHPHWKAIATRLGADITIEKVKESYDMTAAAEKSLIKLSQSNGK